MLGRHEWDAVNEDWLEDRQVGWRSMRGEEEVTEEGEMTPQESPGGGTPGGAS